MLEISLIMQSCKDQQHLIDNKIEKNYKNNYFICLIYIFFI